MIVLPDDESTQFPYLILTPLVEAMQELDPHTDPVNDRDGLRIYKRRLNDGDSTQSIGVYPTIWDPDDDSVEMRGTHGVIQTIQRYPFEIQSWVTDMDEERGIRMHAFLAAAIRQVLQISELLEDELPGLWAQLPLGYKEQVAKWGVAGQNYLSAELGNNQFGFLATTQFYVDTQIN